MKVLIFNKNEKNSQVIAQLLKELTFNVITSDSEERVLEELKSGTIDILFLDVVSFTKFPKAIDQIVQSKINNYTLLSIDKNDKFSKTEALLKGIDDYIYNDFKLEELSAKIKSIVRVIIKRDNDSNSEILSLGDLSLNPMNREVKRQNIEIELTNKEFLLLEYFLRNKNRVLTKTMISEKIWDIDFITESNIVDVYINFLRSKIDKNFDKKIIKTVRGVGYIVKED